MEKLGDRLTGAFAEGSPANKKQLAANKKLKKFQEKGASLSSRFKALISFLEKASEEDLRKFFNDNFYVIYGVFLDTFSSYENQCKRGRHDASILKDLLIVLKNVLVYLSDYVKKGWQIRSIGILSSFFFLSFFFFFFFFFFLFYLWHPLITFHFKPRY
jgi:hypothetical protein